jgi:hypothetical protein
MSALLEQLAAASPSQLVELRAMLDGLMPGGAA